MNVTLSNHVIDRLTTNRPLMSVDTLRKVAGKIGQLVSKFDPAIVHQVAVKVYQFDKPRHLGNSDGDCLIIMVDIRKMVIPTCFVRYAWQGKPKMAQVMIDLTGKIL